MGRVRETIDFFWGKLFAYYVIFAGLATVVDFLVLAGLVELIGFNYLQAAAISYTCGMITNFSLNKFLNFRNRSNKIARQFGLFIIVALIGLGINQIILYLTVSIFGLYYLIGKLISVAIVMFWSFFGHRKITFALVN